MRTERIEVAEAVELAVDRWEPDGPTIAPRPGLDPGFMLVHGLASNARLWDGVAQRLAAVGHPVATVDLRGHGRSAKPDGPYDVPTVATDLASLIDRLGLDRPIVAGQSWGGNVVLELAARHPGAVRGIVCVDGGWLEPSRAFPDWDACMRALAPPHLVGRPVGQIEGHLRAAHPDWSEAAIQATLANFEIRPDGTVAPWLTYARHMEVLRGLWDHHPPDLYPAVAAPVLLVPVDGDGAGPIDGKRHAVEAAQSALPTARVTWLHGDHDIHAQRPDELAGVMLATLREGYFG